MSDSKIITFNADVKGVKIVHSRNVLQIILEMDKAFLKKEGMQKAHHDLVDCEAGDKTYRVMLMEVELAEETVDKVKAKEEAQYPDKPIVSKGFPWGILKQLSFARYIEEITGYRVVDENNNFDSECVKFSMKNVYEVDSTKQMTQEQINGLIRQFNEWELERDKNGIAK